MWSKHDVRKNTIVNKNSWRITKRNKQELDPRIELKEHVWRVEALPKTLHGQVKSSAIKIQNKLNIVETQTFHHHKQVLNKYRPA